MDGWIDLVSLSLKDWILAQMRKCSTPVHPVMVQVLALYIERTLPFLKKNSDGVEEWFSLQKPFGAAEICSVLYEIWEPTKLEMKRLRTIDLFTRSADRDASVGLVHVSKILMAFYVLAFNNYYMNHLKTFSKSDKVCKMKIFLFGSIVLCLLLILDILCTSLNLIMKLYHFFVF